MLVVAKDPSRGPKAWVVRNAYGTVFFVSRRGKAPAVRHADFMRNFGYLPGRGQRRPRVIVQGS